MKTFIDTIIDEISPTDLADLKTSCYVFPSKRACLHFSSALKDRFSKEVFFSPDVLSIEDFVVGQSKGLALGTELSLLLELYSCYKGVRTDLTFDSFYGWGRILLNDFDEIDRYLVEANVLYTNLQSLQDIQQAFGPDESVIKALKVFHGIIGKSESEITRVFKETWTTAGQVYPTLVERLSHKGLAYPGMCYRRLSEGLRLSKIKIDYSQINFCGFNALTISEKTIITHLLENDQARVYLDVDSYYMNNPQQEAGNFMRQLQQEWKKYAPRVRWITSNTIVNSHVNLVSTGDRIAQANVAAELVKDDQNTAIVLADESLLKPLLYSLPCDMGSFNVTMGYSIKESLYSSLITSVINFRRMVRSSGQGLYVEKNATIQLVEHPLVKGLIPGPVFDLVQTTSAWISYSWLHKAIGDDDLLKNLLATETRADFIITSLINVVLSLHSQYIANEKPEAGLNEQLVYTLVRYLYDLRLSLKEESSINPETLLSIITQEFASLRARLEGEPLAGLQIMGFLETRALDFKNIILLSLNEDILPRSNPAASFIPFALRKAFGLPTFIEQNGIYAYHFFRLLQRSKNIHLVYNTQLSIDGSGEMSRFLLQLKHYLPDKQVHEYYARLEGKLVPASLPPIRIKKTRSVIDELQGYFNSQNSGKSITPTVLVDYIHCPLKFYLSRIKKIKPPEEPGKGLDAREVGNLFHSIIHKLYAPYIGKKLTYDNFRAIMEDTLADQVDLSFQNTIGQSPLNGEETFTKQVIAHILDQIIKADRQDSPIEIIDLESSQNKWTYSLDLQQGTNVQLGGIIDRVDRIQVTDGPLTRIIDYKTGRVEMAKTSKNRKPLNSAEYIAQYFEEPELKSGFQLLFYGLLFRKNNPGDELTLGIYSARSLSQGLQYLTGVPQPLPVDWLIEFEEQLRHILVEIVDPTTDFYQTEKVERCRYCEFKGICGR